MYEILNNKENNNILNININNNSIFKIDSTNINNEKNFSNRQINRRNYGIDLLRIISMINIINLHINIYSRVLFIDFTSPLHKPVWILEIFSYWPVNSFGLISGIVGYKKYKFSNLIYIWIQVSFYSIIISLYLYIKNIIKVKDLILSFFPILIKRHWYVNAYFSMYLFLPFINNGIKNLDRNELRNIIIFLIAFYSLYNLWGVIIINQGFPQLSNGFSGLWLAILYIFGAYLGKYIIINISRNNYPKIFYFLVFLFSSFFNSEFYFKLLNSNYINKRQILINYTSPIVILQAFSLLMIFSRINILNKYMIKFISFFSPLTFSVQLIHSRIFTSVPKIFIFFRWVRQFNPNTIFFKIYGLSIIIYFICILVDYMRLLIFKLFKIREFCSFIEKNFPKLMNRLL